MVCALMITFYHQAKTPIVGEVQISNLLIDIKGLQVEKIETHWMIQNVNRYKSKFNNEKNEIS